MATFYVAEPGRLGRVNGSLIEWRTAPADWSEVMAERSEQLFLASLWLSTTVVPELCEDTRFELRRLH
jgi:hypothetical protein